MMEAEIAVMQLLVGDHKPRNADGLWKLERTRKQHLPLSLQKTIVLSL